ncbi:MAG: TonB-dependent receptor [Deltaproteobacteria bacterium]|jgi:iron complex outermembrane receptor protein|nr:TonB-dependent receptor [Deltaproteobacteria bacterium]
MAVGRQAGAARIASSAGRRRTGPARGRSLLTLVLLLAAPVVHAGDLTDLSLEELMNVEVTSVSKKAQSKSDTAAAITVITAEDIRRGGFTLIPEALRTVPGLQVARVDANRWAISARGFNSLFANKLLVLIDGRSVYTPTFGGTYWDVQDYPIEDVERIEVIRGPGGTIWGANAVNGVINIITKNSKDTQGTLLSGYGGSHEYGATGRYGGAIGEDTHYRAYVRGFKVEDQDVRKDGDGTDEWNQVRGGFRADSQPTEKDSFRISVDYYDEDNEQNVLNPLGVPTFVRADYDQRGGNVLIHWQHRLSEESSFQAKAYYDGARREYFLKEDRHTADVDLQHDFVPIEDVSITWGANYRFSTSHVSGPSAGIPVVIDPNDEDFHLFGGFGQVQVDLFDDMLSLIAGTKLYYDSWVGFEVQPSGRFVLRAAEGHSVWGAVSRAVRTPTQTDRDLALTLPGVPPTVLNGDRGFRSEELLGFELGYRFFALERVNAELSLFWNEYDSVSTLVTRFPPFPPPVNGYFSNRGETSTRGFEVELNLLPTDWWRLRMAYTFLDIDEDEDSPLPPDLIIELTDEKDSNPQHQLNVQTFFDLPMGFEFDASLYYVDGLNSVIPTGQTKNVEQYLRLDLRLGYQPFDWLELSLVGQNLTDRRHYEYNDVTLGESTQVPRSGYGKVTLRF